MLLSYGAIFKQGNNSTPLRLYVSLPMVGMAQNKPPRFRTWGFRGLGGQRMQWRHPQERSLRFLLLLVVPLASIAARPAVDPVRRGPAQSSQNASSQPQTAAPSVAGDPRVDLHLKAIFHAAETNRGLSATAALPDLRAPGAESDACALVSVDYGRATPDAVIDLLIEGTMDVGQL